MATKKKTNFIVYELQRLEKYIAQLQSYLDNVDLESLKDRLDVRYSQNGNPIVKVIASEEAQVKSYRENLEKLPSMYESLNRLRKIASEGSEDDTGTPEKARGGVEIPGIFKQKMLKSSEEDGSNDDDNDDIWDAEDD